MTSMVRLAANRTSRGAGADLAVDLDNQGPACRPKALIIEPDTPDGEELSECDGVGLPTLQPYLARGVMGMHGGLERANPVDSHVRRHVHWRAIHGDTELDDV